MKLEDCVTTRVAKKACLLSCSSSDLQRRSPSSSRKIFLNTFLASPSFSWPAQFLSHGSCVHFPSKKEMIVVFMASSPSRLHAVPNLRFNEDEGRVIIWEKTILGGSAF